MVGIRSRGEQRCRRTTYLSREGQRGLVKPLLLGVANVGGDDFLEGEVLVSPLELLAVLLGLDRELAANGVLDLEDGGVEVFGEEGEHGGR